MVDGVSDGVGPFTSLRGECEAAGRVREGLARGASKEATLKLSI